VVALGFAVYAIFPIVLINAPEDAAVLAALFAFSGRFAGLPAHKALIVGPAERVPAAGDRRVPLLRNLIVIPSAALGGLLWDGFSNPLTGAEVFAGDPTVAFTIATGIGSSAPPTSQLFGKEFEAYHRRRGVEESFQFRYRLTVVISSVAWICSSGRLAR